MNKNTLPATIVTGIAVIGIVILAATGNAVPDALSLIAAGGVGVVGGQSIPNKAE